MDRILKPKDVKEILGCSMTTTYSIINQKDFPKIIIGKRAYINPKALEDWISKYTFKTYVL